MHHAWLTWATAKSQWGTHAPGQVEPDMFGAGLRSRAKSPHLETNGGKRDVQRKSPGTIPALATLCEVKGLKEWQILSLTESREEST